MNNKSQSQSQNNQQQSNSRITPPPRDGEAGTHTALPVPTVELGAAAAIEQSRAVQQVQAALVIAKRFPRDPIAAETKILKSCERFGVADKALYKYRRGNELVEGLTIRMAEEIQRAWGNMESGFVELSRDKGISEVEAFSWDLETNSRFTRTFTVEHRLQLKDGKVKFLTDPRDIYEMVSNQAQRRVRACILENIPSDISENATQAVKKTLLAGPGKLTVLERVKQAVVGFDSIGVKQTHLEKYLGHPIDITTGEEVANLLVIFQSITKEGVPREDFFDIEGNAKSGSSQGGEAEKLSQQLNKKPAPLGSPEDIASAAMETDGTEG